MLLEELVKLAKLNADIEVVWLYGSRALGTDLEHSDYDIAIAFKNFKLSALNKFLRPNELALEWSQLLGISENKLSLVDINRAPIYLAYNIVSDGQIIYQTRTVRANVEYDRIENRNNAQ